MNSTKTFLVYVRDEFSYVPDICFDTHIKIAWTFSLDNDAVPFVFYKTLMDCGQEKKITNKAQ